ncbi:flagellar hook-basal body complex protein FliE [Magnetospirillum fulvum]|jgi:flagellar hook-basal body complex protein FliE|uniref:Flagellar hook-basal body complex protein FliE n=1 Tax=Magnetospirillum fulvum MGU-K5 TaxID=1316936 RepID=S9TL38_MAGFU|nr:flagellar hook-basal body complex protein FliE [Magnetospirillum fulvum]EPY02986.1 flagellar hook-basal body protein FliE [Magnetospirillum fulvum MGU-K5]
MTSSITNAISAYRTAADPLAALGGSSSSSETSATDAGTGTDFASVLKDAAKVAIGGAKEAERASLSAVAGKADIREVVAAVANTELTLNTVVNIRDKVINAYTEILRMPI